MINRALLFVVTLLITSGCRDAVRIYEIPDGFVGWVTVRQATPCATSRTDKDGTTIVVSSEGIGCADASPAPKSFYRRFYYVDRAGQHIRELRASGWGKGGQIWGESAPSEGDEYRFFVGQEEMYKRTYEKPPQRR